MKEENKSTNGTKFYYVNGWGYSIDWMETDSIDTFKDKVIQMEELRKDLEKACKPEPVPAQQTPPRSQTNQPAQQAPAQPAQQTPAGNPPACPKCGFLMIERQGKWGPFYGCTNYPNCDGKLKVN